MRIPLTYLLWIFCLAFNCYFVLGDEETSKCINKRCMCI